MDNARLLAAKTLLRVEERGAWSNLSLDAVLNKSKLDSRQSAFASALFYGVIERALTLDACIAAHSKRPPEALSPAVRIALRMGVYQLLYMDSVPDSAAVDESVELTRALRVAKASGYVNGVLRAFLRAEKQIPCPRSPTDLALSVRYSCPRPLVALWLDAYGPEATERFLADSLGRAPLTVRVNTLRTDPPALVKRLEAEEVGAVIHERIPDCLVLSGTGAVHHLAAYRDGLFHVQDVASMLCVEALDPRPGERVLDGCAAPGGKSFTAAQRMGGQGELVAVDLHEKRAALVARRAAEMGLGCVWALAGDMREPLEALEPASFDRVLCDLPCSGLGVIRRKPEIKYKPLESFQEIPSIQYKILENTAHYCRPGGVLVYSTCTLNPAENEAVCERFLTANSEFEPLPLDGLLARGSHQRTLMGELGADGFYIARMRRKGGGQA